MNGPADLDDLRIRLVDYLNKTGTELTKRGTRYLGLCPHHDDRDPSFAVYGSNLSVCGCYPCGFTGDVFAVAQWLGRAHGFPAAIQHVAEVLGRPLPHGDVLRPERAFTKRVEVKPPVFDADMIHRARIEWDDRYFGECPVAFIAMHKIGLPPEAFRWCSHGKSGLGWAKGSICYLYPQGLKWRNPAPEAKPRFMWLTGKATAPWRADWIKPETRTCYITEGESDCIALVAAGLEEDGSIVCTAIPGADGFAEEWAPLYRGKLVVLCFDDDHAGRAARTKVAAILKGIAAEILTWKGPMAHE